MLKRGALLAAAASVALFGHIAGASAQDGKWRTGKELPQTIGEIFSAVVGNKWYVFGGLDGPNVQARGVVLVYDQATDSWTEKKKMQVPAHHGTSVALDGKIYIFGGFVGRPGTKVWQPIGTAMEYDPAADSWKELAPMPTPRGSAQAVAVDGKIYVIGGAHFNLPGKDKGDPFVLGQPQSQMVTGAVEEYDPKTNTWRARSPMPTGRNHFFAGAVDGKIYAINGRLGTSFVTLSDTTDIVEEYDPKNDVWTFKSRAPTRRGDVSGAVVNGKLYVVGGEMEEPRGKVTFWAFEAYDPKANSWSILPRTIWARHGGATDVIGNEIHTAGGSFQSDGMPGIFTQMATHEVFAVAK